MSGVLEESQKNRNSILAWLGGTKSKKKAKKRETWSLFSFSATSGSDSLGLNILQMLFAVLDREMWLSKLLKLSIQKVLKISYKIMVFISDNKCCYPVNCNAAL